MGYSSKGREGGSAVYSVRMTTENGEQTHETEEGIFGEVIKNLAPRFRPRFTAPCYSGELFDDIRFIGDTAAAKAILEGTYVYPPVTDPATRLLLEEAAITYAIICPEEVSRYVTVEDFQYH